MQVPKRAEHENLRITGVGALDGDTFGITLESGHTILLELGGRIREPAFAALIESGAFCKPYTDGERLCWPGGMSLTVKEILGMLLSQDGTRQVKGKINWQVVCSFFQQSEIDAHTMNDYIHIYLILKVIPINIMGNYAQSHLAHCH